MPPLLGVLDAPIHQPRVDLGVGAAPRDRFIGWTPQLREKNLPLVVDNPRFLILPWIEIPNLGSHILAIIRRRLPDDWTERYNTTPVLIETFVETRRTLEGLSKREIMRCLKRYVAREIYRVLTAPSSA